jgi:hypothetical protein
MFRTSMFVFGPYGHTAAAERKRKLEVGTHNEDRDEHPAALRPTAPGPP